MPCGVTPQNTRYFTVPSYSHDAIPKYPKKGIESKPFLSLSCFGSCVPSGCRFWADMLGYLWLLAVPGVMLCNVMLMQAWRHKRLKLPFTRTIKSLGRQKYNLSACAAGSLPNVGWVPQRGNCTTLKALS